MSWYRDKFKRAHDQRGRKNISDRISDTRVNLRCMFGAKALLVMFIHDGER